MNMTDNSGFRASIHIPMSRYQQLLQHQSAQTTEAQTQTSPTKIKHKKLSDNDSVTSESNETVTDKGLTFHKVKESHDQPKSIENASAEGETNEAAIERKLLFKIKHSFSKPLREKIRRLFLFIINFGYHVISFNLLGNVFIRNHLLDRRSSILDLLRACVSVTASKPVGYSEFRKALFQINVPKTMLDLSGRLTPTINGTKKNCLQEKVRKYPNGSLSDKFNDRHKKCDCENVRAIYTETCSQEIVSLSVRIENTNHRNTVQFF